MKKEIKRMFLSFNGWEDHNASDVSINFEDVSYFEANNIFEHKVKYISKGKHIFVSEKCSKELVLFISPSVNKNKRSDGKTVFEYMLGRDDLTGILFIDEEGELVDRIVIPWSDQYKDYVIETKIQDNGDFYLGIKPCEIDWGNFPWKK